MKKKRQGKKERREGGRYKRNYIYICKGRKGGRKERKEGREGGREERFLCSSLNQSSIQPVYFLENWRKLNIA